MSRTFTLEVYIENFITNVNVNSHGLDKQWTLVTMDILVVDVTAANEKKSYTSGPSDEVYYIY